MEAEFNVNFEVADLSTIHEAYQFLFKKYVADLDNFKNENFLTAEEIRKKHEKRKKKREKLAKEGKNGDEGKNMDVDDIADLKLKGRKARKARRNSFIKMTGLDVDAEKDQASLDASAIASECLDCPTPNLKRRGSTKRRKSILLGLSDVGSDSSSGDESIGPSASNSRSNSRRGSLRPLIDAQMGTSKKDPSPSRSRRNSGRRKSLMPDDEDGPSGTSLLNHRVRTPSPMGRARTQTTVSLSLRRKSLFDDEKNPDEQMRPASPKNTTYSVGPINPYPAGILPDPSPQLKRRGSAYRSMKKKKDKNKPYPKRKGSFRRFGREEDDE